ncbi:MAG: glycoside hydrolase family 1 protein [Candidatus Omnitrophica bacterium]|nr:glycoside hydrolase family 1 protein [Candidatus Omnitrophota bacterium]
MTILFPEGFFWGAALSSYQSEGGNINTDWAHWEKEHALEKAAAACDHYNRFKEDFNLARSMHLNSLRLSFEWARVNPEPDVFSSESLQHYNQVVDELLNFKLKPFLTLHHFTNPDWFMKKGGWLNPANIDFFISYVRNIAQALKGKVEYWIVFNEPLVYIYHGYITGIWPPGIRNFGQAKKAMDNILKAYAYSYQEIKQTSSREFQPLVSIAKHIRFFSPCTQGSGLLNCFSSFLRDKYFNINLIEHLKKRKILDYLAINYYCKEYVQFKGIFGRECSHDFHPERRNNVGWYVSPEGFYDTLIRLKRYRLPIFVSENGTAESQEYLYKEYLEAHLQSLARACSKGVDLRGYFWWSLFDNFEWEKGYGPRFGLYEVDYKDFRRYPRPYSSFYADVCKYNKIEV